MMHDVFNLVRHLYTEIDSATGRKGHIKAKRCISKARVIGIFYTSLFLLTFSHSIHEIAVISEESRISY